MINLDTTNQGILDILQRDARTSIADIGRAVGRAESTVRERVAALESHRVIRGYHAAVDPKALGYGVAAVITGSPELAEVSALSADVSRIPNLRSALLTTGEHPLLMNVVASDLAALERIMVDRIAPLGLGHVNTEIVVRELVQDRPLQPVSGAQIAVRPKQNGEGGYEVQMTPDVRHRSASFHAMGTESVRSGN